MVTLRYIVSYSWLKQVELSAIDPVVARVVSTEYVFQLGFMLVVPVLLVS